MMKRFAKSEDGNIAMMTGLAGLALMVGVGMAIDLSAASTSKLELQGIVDSAALAGASASEESRTVREETVRASIAENAADFSDLDLAAAARINFDDARDEVTVSIPYTKPLFFAGLVGRESMRFEPSATVSFQTTEVAPITVALALDSSGSMRHPAGSGEPKIEVLQDATRLLFEELEGASENPALLLQSLRTSLAAYNTNLVAEADFDYGWRHMTTSVDNLIADGGTNSTPALQKIYDDLLDDRTFRTLQNRNFELSTLTEFVLFMTDGDNNQPVFDEDSSAICQAMRDDGILIYSVAFTAPEKGQLLLLDCASWNTDDRNDDDDDDDDDFDDDDDRCENNGRQGRGRALGHCRDDDDDVEDMIEDLREDKSEFYFDADDADAFRDAFAAIGRDISKSDIRIKS